VYLKGEDSDEWHSGWGGGLWFGFVERKNAVVLTYARSGEGGRIYVTSGFHF